MSAPVDEDDRGSAGYEPGCLMADPEFRKIHGLFQRLWTKAVGQDEYDKKEWQQMDNYLVELATKGRKTT